MDAQPWVAGWQWKHGSMQSLYFTTCVKKNERPLGGFCPHQFNEAINAIYKDDAPTNVCDELPAG